MEREASRRVILIDANDVTREVLAARLRSQGYDVEPVPDGATGADLALSAPPAAVISDLWLPSISGVQICRLLRSEAATAEVPVILRGERDDPRSRFWAERAGAVAYVAKGRMGDLVRALGKACAEVRSEDQFFMQLSGGTMDIRDRIAQHLDAALFDSVIASEVRALSNAGEFPRLFDQLSQLMSQLSAYRWLALCSSHPEHFGLHCHPRLTVQAEAEARAALGLGNVAMLTVQDEDASSSTDACEPLVFPVRFANNVVGTIALAPTRDDHPGSAELMPLVARELGGPLRMAALVEESQRQASIDVLTGLMNRRAFMPAIRNEVSRGKRYGHHLCVLLLDIDHFKQINDHFGHAAGDLVLGAVGKMLSATLRGSDFAARWGGEEFVIALTNTEVEGGRIAAERARVAVENLAIDDGKGQRIAVTASVGLASLLPDESVEQLMDRADHAMYAAKYAGRNRVGLDEPAADAPRILSYLPAKSQGTGTGTVPAIVVGGGRDPRAS
ncbi:MAG TPA: diguanylate cyclase [Polyangiales bacterium]|nr:diguanylate cyclase [Polyangiales bacterium]